MLHVTIQKCGVSKIIEKIIKIQFKHVKIIKSDSNNIYKCHKKEIWFYWTFDSLKNSEKN